MRKKLLSLLFGGAFSLFLVGCQERSDIVDIEKISVQLEGEINNQILVVTNVYTEELEMVLEVETKSGRKFSRKFKLSPWGKKEFGRIEIGMRWEQGDKYSIKILGMENDGNNISGECK